MFLAFVLIYTLYIYCLILGNSFIHSIYHVHIYFDILYLVYCGHRPGGISRAWLWLSVTRVLNRRGI